MDVFFNAKNARIFFIKLKLMRAKALRLAKGRNIFRVDELMMEDGCWMLEDGSWMMDVGCWKMDDFFNAKALLFFMIVFVRRKETEVTFGLFIFCLVQ